VAGIKSFTSRIVGSVLRAIDANGVKLEDDAGNVGLIVLDGGEVVVVGADSFTEPYSGFTAQANHIVVVRQPTATAANTPFVGFVFANNQTGIDHNLAQLLFMNEAIVGTDKRIAQVLVQTDGATDDGRIIFRTFNGGVSNDVLKLLSSGDVVLSGAVTIPPTANMQVEGTVGLVTILRSTGGSSGAFRVGSSGSGSDGGRLQGRYLSQGLVIQSFDAATKWATIEPAGLYLGGEATPKGILHAYDGTSGKLFVTKTGVAGSEVEIIPNGAGDVVRGVQIHGVAYSSAGGFLNINISSIATPGAGSTTATLAGTLAAKLYSTGQLVLLRTGAGAETYNVSLIVTWL
jgi:hypothetical protein